MKFPERSNHNLSYIGQRDYPPSTTTLRQIQTNTNKTKDNPTTNFRIGLGLTTRKTNKYIKTQNLTKATTTQIIILETINLNKKESDICQIQKRRISNCHSTQWQSCAIDILSLISTVAKTSY